GRRRPDFERTHPRWPGLARGGGGHGRPQRAQLRQKAGGSPLHGHRQRRHRHLGLPPAHPGQNRDRLRGGGTEFLKNVAGTTYTAPEIRYSRYADYTYYRKRRQPPVMKIIFYGTRDYDRLYFDLLAADPEYGCSIKFLAANLDVDTAPLAEGGDA